MVSTSVPPRFSRTIVPQERFCPDSPSLASVVISPVLRGRDTLRAFYTPFFRSCSARLAPSTRSPGAFHARSYSTTIPLFHDPHTLAFASMKGNSAACSTMSGCCATTDFRPRGAARSLRPRSSAPAHACLGPDSPTRHRLVAGTPLATVGTRDRTAWPRELRRARHLARGEKSRSGLVIYDWTCPPSGQLPGCRPCRRRGHRSRSVARTARREMLAGAVAGHIGGGDSPPGELDQLGNLAASPRMTARAAGRCIR